MEKSFPSAKAFAFQPAHPHWNLISTAGDEEKDYRIRKADRSQAQLRWELVAQFLEKDLDRVWLAKTRAMLEFW